MTISFISNQSADFARQNLEASSTRAQNAMTRVSSGNRVFSAKEDAAALSISTGLKADVSALRAADINTKSGSATLQIVDGALSQISDILGRMEALASQAASGQLSSVERGYLDGEFNLMRDEINRISESTNFNGLPLLGGQTEIIPNAIGVNVDADNGFVGVSFSDTVDPTDTFEFNFVESTSVMTITSANRGISQTIHVETPAIGQLGEYTFDDLGVTLTLNSAFDDSVDLVHAGADEEISVQAGTLASGATFEFQVGRGTTNNDRIAVDMPVINITSLGLDLSSIDTDIEATAAMDAIRSAVTIISSERAKMGAQMNRLEIASKNIQVSMENTQGANSALVDADIAREVTELTAQQVLSQASTNILAQANQRPGQLLELLGR